MILTETVKQEHLLQNLAKEWVKCCRKFYFLGAKGLKISRDCALVLRVGGVGFLLTGCY